jgi:RarD protein
MLIFGSIGIIVRGIALSSAQIALIRGVIGSVFLIIAGLIMKKKPSTEAIRRNFIYLLLSGAALGFNWILLFEAYRNTSITNATFTYYLAPVIVVFLSPFIFRERLNLKKIIPIIFAVIGMLLLVLTCGEKNTYGNGNGLLGIGFGLGAALLYAMVIILNKLIKGLRGIETTIIQLTMASLVLAPYVILRGSFELSVLGAGDMILLILVGLLNTGLAYLLYFSSIQKLESQTVAILSYIDPVSAVLMSGILLGEKITAIQLVGGILILGGTFMSGRDRKKI